MCTVQIRYEERIYIVILYVVTDKMLYLQFSKGLDILLLRIKLGTYVHMYIYLFTQQIARYIHIYLASRFCSDIDNHHYICAYLVNFKITIYVMGFETFEF